MSDSSRWSTSNLWILGLALAVTLLICVCLCVLAYGLLGPQLGSLTRGLATALAPLTPVVTPTPR